MNDCVSIMSFVMLLEIKYEVRVYYSWDDSLCDYIHGWKTSW